jgi:hypothetical protein
MASKEDKLDIRNAKRSANQMRKGGLRVQNNAAVKFNKSSRAEVKAGRPGGALKTTSSGYKVTKTNSATKPSMPVKTGVKNKIKAQGKAMSKGGLNYSGRKK